MVFGTWLWDKKKTPIGTTGFSLRSLLPIGFLGNYPVFFDPQPHDHMFVL